MILECESIFVVKNNFRTDALSLEPERSGTKDFLRILCLKI